jgi:hypothetical protein
LPGADSIGSMPHFGSPDLGSAAALFYSLPPQILSSSVT